MFNKPVQDMKIVVFGAGAVGATVGGWLSVHHKKLYFFDHDPVSKALKENGITLYHGDEPEKKKKYKVNVIENINELKDADIIILSVKNYNLDEVAQSIKEVAGDKPYIISMANGIENQKILPKYFSKVIYSVISYNAWVDEPGVVGYQTKGKLIFGTPDNSLPEDMNTLSVNFKRVLDIDISENILDAVHTKIIINLTNALTTLIGHGFKPISDFDIFQILLPNTLYEGVKVVKAAGYKECTIGEYPSWLLLTIGAKLPRFMARGIFKKNVAKMKMSSMTQDIIKMENSDSEIESLTGYIVDLANKYGIAVPFNKAILDLCRERFAREKFKPMDVTEVWHKVQQNIDL
ncbi:MAG: ketopantoate reductase family protein [Desulfobacterales bacterium]|nr:ketopantoate reductase family protein [Desulfobacterales bacterium]MCP4162718.1 ketopantoate reductase family protein [Deltaproteobacteria bacterium]